MKYGLKQPLESYTRSKIEERLRSLGYCMDEKVPNECNVYRERAKYEYQDELLKGKNPDFLIYKKDSSEILAVIEAKRPSVSLDKAIEQAINYYAKPLNIPIVFVYNSGAFYACTQNKKPIRIDHIELNDFVDEKTLIKLISNDFDIESAPAGFTTSREELLKVFKKANDLLRKAGLRDGYERFSVFSDLMFLKLKNEFSDIGEITTSEKSLDKSCNWKKMVEKTPSFLGENFKIEESEVKSYLEDTIKKKLKETYGDVFESSLNIKDESILIELIELIDRIPFQNVDSDVKGDAFEYFLKNVTNGNKDLGEYYTPRHIVKMIVKLLNPSYGEKIYDPCCGTGGFLLECFKYLRSHTNITIDSEDDDKTVEEKKEKKRIIREESIYGREITSTSRIAKMNMILFGDGHTNIKQMDCLSSVVNENYEVVVSNIPYSQKVEHGSLYDFPTTKGDSLFMQHIWKSVKSGSGRMAVVVPETFLYSEDTFDIRKKIVDESSHLIIVSLPRGVFNPYTPTKTSVIVAYKKRKSQKPLEKGMYAYIIRNDGFELGARRRPLPGASDCNKFLMDYNEDEALRYKQEPNSTEISYSQIKESGYDLLPFSYMEHLPKTNKTKDLVVIKDYVKERNELFDYDSFDDKEQECVILSVTKNGIYCGDILSAQEMNNLSQRYKRVYPGDFTYNPHRINVGSIGIVPNLSNNMYVSYIYPVFYLQNDAIPPYYILKQLKNNEYKTIINDYCIGGARADLKFSQLEKIKIVGPSKSEKDRIIELSQKMEKAYQEYLSLYTQLMV